jgi:hypothetical protein
MAVTTNPSPVASLVSATILATVASEVRFYEKKLAEFGLDFAALTPAEALAVNRKWHGEWQASSDRKAEKANAEAAREAEREAARKAREIANAKRDRDKKIALVNGAVKAEILSRKDADEKIAAIVAKFAPLIAAAEKAASA